MPALTSAQAIANALKQHQDDPFLVLLTISHDSIADGPIYVVRNNKNIVSRGNTYIAIPFEIELPTDGDESPSAKLTLANVSRSIGQSIEALVEPPDVLIEIVLASDPDTVERSWDEFSFHQASYDAGLVTATVQHVSYWQESCPWKRIRPEKFPGLFE